jgi:hypothetical protein
MNTILLQGGGASTTEAFDGEEGTAGSTAGRRRVLELVVASREAAPGKGAR